MPNILGKNLILVSEKYSKTIKKEGKNAFYNNYFDKNFYLEKLPMEYIKTFISNSFDFSSPEFNISSILKELSNEDINFAYLTESEIDSAINEKIIQLQNEKIIKIINELKDYLIKVQCLKNKKSFNCIEFVSLILLAWLMK